MNGVNEPATEAMPILNGLAFPIDCLCGWLIYAKLQQIPESQTNINNNNNDEINLSGTNKARHTQRRVRHKSSLVMSSLLETGNTPKRVLFGATLGVDGKDKECIN